MTYTAHEIIGGLYEKTVKMTVDRRLRYMPYAQAGWKDYAVCDNYGITTDHCKAMYSYSSLIFTATVNVNGVVAMIDTYDAKASADCSRTTSWQVTLALRELGFSDAVAQAIKRYIASQPSGAAVRQCGRDWIDTATGDVVYAGGATV
mgnify:CR=1 FL=1